MTKRERLEYLKKEKRKEIAEKSAEEIAYPYAIMKYKYGDVSYIYIPESKRTDEVILLVEKYIKELDK